MLVATPLRALGVPYLSLRAAAAEVLAPSLSCVLATHTPLSPLAALCFSALAMVAALHGPLAAL